MSKPSSYILHLVSLILALLISACGGPKDPGSVVLLGEPLVNPWGEENVEDDLVELVGGKTALHLAIEQNKSLDDIQHLLDSGARINAPDQQGLTPLHYAAMFSHSTEVITLLLNHGSRLDARTLNRQTVLHLAANNTKNPAVIQLFLDKGSNSNVMDMLGLRAFDYAKYNKNLYESEVYWKLLGKRKKRKKVAKRYGGG